MRGKVPEFEKSWRIRLQSNHFGWNDSVVNFSYFATKNRLRKTRVQRCNFFRVGNRTSIVCFLPWKSCTFAPFKIWQCTGEVFPHLLIFLLIWKQHLALSRGFVCGTWNRHTVATGLGTHKEKKVWVDIHVQATGSQICLHNMCGQQRNAPMADPIFGSKYGPQNGVQNWITFSFLLLGLCLGPVLGSRFGPKSGASHRKILLLPAEVLQADLRMSVSVNTCFFSLCVPLCFLYSQGPFLAAMFLLVFWILFWGPWWSRFVGIRGAPRLTEACPRHAWQELLWQKPPLRTSTCGRHRFRRNHPLWEPRMWQGQVWEARADGETWWGVNAWQGHVWKEAWKPQVGRRELLNTKTSPREGEETAENPSPPYNVPHIPLGIRRAGCFLLPCISQTPEMHPRPFFGCFWHPQWSFARVLPHPQGHPQASARALADLWIKMAAFPDLALRRCCLAEIARACNHSSWFKFSSSQYPLENYKLRNMVRFRAILCLGVPIQCQRLQFYRRPWCQRFYRDFMAPLPCENTSAAWQLFFTARTWAKPHRFESSVTLLLRRVVQSKTQWHS